MYRPCKIATFASVKGCQNNFHRIREYAELDLSRALRVQLLALHRAPQQSYTVPESVTQMLPELWQAWCSEHFPGELVQCPTTSWEKTF